MKNFEKTYTLLSAIYKFCITKNIYKKFVCAPLTLPSFLTVRDTWKIRNTKSPVPVGFLFLVQENSDRKFIMRFRCIPNMDYNLQCETNKTVN